MDRGWLETIRRTLRQRLWVSVALVTLLTLGLVGAVVLTTTSAGCGPANWLHVKTTHCPANLAANLGGVTPSAAGKGLVSPLPANSPSPLPTPPDNSGASSFPPNNPGASSYPPYNPGSSGAPPFTTPGSYGTPPLANPTSGNTYYQSLSCRLPVYAGGPGSGGFIVFPGGTFVADPRSAVSAPSPSSGPTPTPPPYGGYGGYVGWWGTTYDAAYAKWLPVPYAWVSPDGVHYAYALNNDIYVQNVRGGAELELGEGQGFFVLDVENDGVYVTKPNQPGLWFLTFSGGTRQITTIGFWQGVASGAAYGTETSQVPQGATNTILKLDVQSGAATPFFSWSGAQSSVDGFDLQGHPVIQVNYQGGVALFIVSSPNNWTAIADQNYQSYGPQPSFPSGRPIADKHGLWFSAGQGIVIYMNGAWYAVSAIGGQLAGQCL